MKQVKFLALALITSLVLTSCSNDDDTAVNEEEVITTVIVSFISGDATVVLTSRDLDGDGPNPPVITQTGNFMNGVTYTGTIQFLNELESPVEDITEEIEAEAEEHQVFYQLTPGSLGSFAYTDADADGNPIGLSFTFTTSNTGTGNLVVMLRHELNKNGSGVAGGDSTNAGGETDVEVVFPVVIQ